MLHRFVHDHLVLRRWSPEQIAQRLRRMKPDDPSARVSHETIYAAIYAQPRGGLKAAMIDALRQAKPPNFDSSEADLSGLRIPDHYLSVG